ncbi:MAG: lamin tail domain-containing protein [Bacteroidota bacterium]
MKFFAPTLIRVLIILVYPITNHFSQTGQALTFSEVMFRPLETNGEFVEIYNTSSTETIDISNYKFKYYTSSNNNFVSVIGGTLLGPGKFAVIIQGNYDWTNGLYKNLIPAGTIVMKTSGNNFGSSGMANETSREVYLINAAGQTIDTYTYSANNPAGISDEKIILNKDNAASNWANSTLLNGSPGKKNSVSPTDYDLSIRFDKYLPVISTSQDSLFITFVVKNLGRVTVNNFIIEIFYDINADSTGQQNENIFTANYNNLAVGDSIIITKSYFPNNPGDYIFIGQVTYTPDEKPANNKTVKKITVADKITAYNEIVINEIMYAPTGDEPEWIELYNPSARTINLRNWRLGDNSAMVVIASSDYLLLPKEYLVISKESTISIIHNITSKLLIRSLPSLNNSGDDVILRDLYSRTIDSTKYNPSWGGNTEGKSLERKSAAYSSLDANNWGSSVSKNKSTPGKVNSISPKDFDLSILSVISNKTYVEPGSSLTLNVSIKNLGRLKAENFELRLFHDANFDSIGDDAELVPQPNLPLQSLEPDQSVVLQITTQNVVLGVNQFIVHVKFVNDEFTDNNEFIFNINGVEINEVRGDLVINEIMYAPAPPEPEWIEIFNKSSKTINLRKYQIADDASKVTITTKDFIIQPGEYVVVAKDSNIFSFYRDISKVIITSIPSLNNSGDRIEISDSLNRMIDSLKYRSTWGGAAGKSLERIAAESASDDSTNWKTTKMERGTPGKINSVSKKNYDIILLFKSVNPTKPIIGQKVKINILFWNPSKNKALFICKLYEILKNGSKLLLKEESVEVPSIEDAGFHFSQMEYNIESLETKRTFEYFADYPLDEDTTNNRYQFSVFPGYPKNSVVVNEIMYNPVNGEPEWIELFNNSIYNIDLEEWSISDLLATPVKTKLQPKGITFLPGTFLVISKDTVINNFHRSVPSQLIVNTFANLNNDADAVIIKDANDGTIDSVRYDKSWGGENGKSLERINITGESNERLNWGSSKDVELSSPGRINSLTPKDYDLTITGISIVPLYASFDEDVNIAVKVFNNGMKSADKFTALFYFISGNDTSYFSQGIGSNLSSKDSVLVLSSSKIKLDKPKRVYCKVLFDKDMDNLNNYYAADVNTGYKRNSLLVSEVMYNPLDGEPEWIEFVNNSNEPINLKDWKVTDLLPSVVKVSVSNVDKFLQPGEYAVLTPDTNKFMFIPPKNFFQVKFGSLGNTSDGIAIYDFRGAVIDSFMYNSRWGGAKGISLERVSLSAASTDSTNWTTSLNRYGATPGFQNSILYVPKYRRSDLVINEIMFDPSSGNSEFIELFNTSADSIQIGGMNLICGSNKKIPLSKVWYQIPPASYLIFASDSTIYNNYIGLQGSFLLFNRSLSLSNDGAILVIKDARNTTIDSVYYSPGWHNKNLLFTKNRSLERLNPLLDSNDNTNWSSSVAPEGASPGKSNSIFTETIVTESKAVITPNPFSPDNDGFEDFATINFNIAKKLAQVRLKVFDNQGRLVRIIAHNRPSGPSNSVIFDGLDDNGRALRIGIYILLIEIVTESGENSVIKLPVVIARKL